MKFYSVTPLTDVCQINLRLDSVDVKFNCHLREGYDPEHDNFVLPHRERWASIEFKDSREIDEFINILQRFKRDTIDYIGRWE